MHRAGSVARAETSRRIHAVVFDMDGTLLDSLPVVVQCYRRTIIGFGGADLSSDEIIAAFRIGPAARMLEALIGRSVGVDAVNAYESRLRTEVHKIVAYDGVPEILASLSKELPLGVFTAADTRAAEMLLTATGLRPALGPVVGADRVAKPKPAPDGLIAVSEQLGVSPADIAYVGDAPGDVQVARACGALAVAAGWGHEHRKVHDADVTVGCPEELLTILAPAVDSRATR